MTDKKLKPDDIDRLFIENNALKDQRKSIFNPDKALCRFEFLSVMIRLAVKKYCEQGDAESEVDAVQRLWTEYLEPHKIDSFQGDPYYYDQ